MTLSARAPLKVSAIVPYPSGASAGQRFRVEQWSRLLGEDRLEVTFHPLFTHSDFQRLYVAGARLEKSARTVRALIRRLAETLSFGRPDVVFLYREAFPLGPAVLEALLAKRHPIVYDFDDAIWLGDTSAANRWIAPLKHPQKVANIIEAATATTVGNSYLAAYARTRSESVQVIPTTIDVDQYFPKTIRKERRGVRIAWTGSPTTARFLSQLEQALRPLLRRPDCELVVIGEPRFEIPGAANVLAVPWSEAVELELLQSVDIGIMPMPDDPWTRGKCGFKALLYMALGVATIASPVGVNREIIVNGVNGLLAGSEQEWVDAITLLTEDPVLRAQLGAAGRETVVDRYSGQQWAETFYGVLSTAATHR